MTGSRVSAGLLPFTVGERGLEVFLGHMGGPYFSKPSARGWTLIKGEFDPAAETARDAASREWREETGTAVPAGDWVDLGSVTQRGGKSVTAFGVDVADPSAVQLLSSTQVRIQWPPHSARWITFPEIDQARWWTPADVRGQLVQAQEEIIDRLVDGHAGGRG